MSGELERPRPLSVAFLVYAACLGWAMLTGLVAGAIYLVVSITTHGEAGVGQAAVIGGAYGAMIGLLAGAVLGLGTALGAGLAARGGSARRAAWVARSCFLASTLLVLLVWRFGLGDEADRWLEWRIVFVVGPALAFGTWRTGRSTRLAMTARATSPTRASPSGVRRRSRDAPCR